MARAARASDDPTNFRRAAKACVCALCLQERIAGPVPVVPKRGLKGSAGPWVALP